MLRKAPQRPGAFPRRLRPPKIHGGMGPDDLEMRDLTAAADYDACVALQRATWGDGFRELVPPAMLKITQQVGGIALGAFDRRGALVGFVFGLTGLRAGRPVHWSHMLAVREDHRDRGVGRRLKLRQRERALALGVTHMYWTFDPLVARNAHLNLNRLGARPVEYVEDMYGHDPMSELDRAVGTDRFVVEWRLDVEGEPEPPGHPPRAPVVTLPPDRPAAAPPLPDADVVLVAIPADIGRLARESQLLARAWRVTTRRALRHYLAGGYAVRGLVRGAAGEHACYVMGRGTETHV